MFLFFLMVGIAMSIAAALQIYTFYDIHDTCEVNIRIAPLVAGSCLLGSFLLNALWVFGKDDIKKMAIVFWSGSVIVGTVSAGATLGQIQLYEELDCEITTSLNLTWIQLISIGLLVISIALPHGVSKKNERPLVRKTTTNKLQPLQFD